MKLFGRKLVGFAKALVVLVAIFLISSGLCGLQMLIANRVNGSDGTMIIMVGIAELAAMLLSAAGIVLLLIAWGLRALFVRSPRPPKEDVQWVLDEKDETKHDER